MEEQSEQDQVQSKSASWHKQLLIPFFILLLLIAATTAVVLYGKGYRIYNFGQGEPKVGKTGILHVTSDPTGAQVAIDGHLTTATESTIDLPPGQYTITMSKDGYFTWTRKIKIQEEDVTNVDASLFPVAPRLDSLAAQGVKNPLVDPSGTKIAFEIDSSANNNKKNGIYILNMNGSSVPLPMMSAQSSSIQIADDTLVPFSTASLSWSPDSTQLLATIPASGQTSQTTYLLDATSLNDSPQDVTAILNTTLATWNTQRLQRERVRHIGLKPKLEHLITDDFNIIAWSPDETKILYQASTSATLPLIITPRLPGINNLSEQRTIKQNALYVYDSKEDTNFPVPVTLAHPCNEEKPDCHLPLTWFPDSSHLLYIHDKKINIMDYDGSNQITLYAGPFADNFAVPWPDGSKLVILTNLGNSDVPPTLYTISLK